MKKGEFTEVWKLSELRSILRTYYENSRTILPKVLFDSMCLCAARISSGALLQVGMDYWRNSTVGYDAGANNHEAGASDGAEHV